MSRVPFMQLYPSDYFAKTMTLTAEQHGAYLLILMTMWQHNARLPNDPVKLARIARMTPAKFKAVWAEISRYFEIDGDEISNDRLAKERKKASEKSQKRAVAGSAGGKAKALKDKNTAGSNCHADAMASSSDTRNYKEEVREDTNVSLSVQAKFSGPSFDAFWALWPLAKTAKKNAESAFRKLSPQDRVEATERVAEWAADWKRRNPTLNDIHPASYLNGKRWTDESQPSLSIIHGGTHAQPARQDRNAAAADRFGRVADAAIRNRAPSSGDIGFG